MEDAIKLIIIDLFSNGAHDVAEIGKDMSTEQRKLYCQHDCMDRVGELLVFDLKKPYTQTREFIDEHRGAIAELAWEYSGINYWRVKGAI
jgi:hypothetical protein